ncbi:MAG: CRISPR-associated endonuclease Cas2 [Acidimicrobiaceae bacterium]|nr:CRISPR-associated endonuclease Cas2 [Acidimicrobiaceae bacterium]MCY4279432.1 CRISPR-associated endonuclease Cas2 [Acidimicrobiaceae bacterium]MCY4294765.1 CRISPR-associated endonuclease Cas2 [Acidimicrobiaceae bacterium]
MDMLVAYDIADTQGSGAKRLRAIHDLCCGYGTRVQFSVFECRLSPARYTMLTSELEGIIDTKKDCVHIYHFGGRPLPECKTVLGTPGSREMGDAWLL